VLGTDQQLALLVADGEERAFDELARRYRRLVSGKCSVYYAPGEEEDDVHQAAMFGLYKAARTFTVGRGRSFRGWASLVIQSELDTFVKKACRGKHRSLSESVRFEQPLASGHELGELLPNAVSGDPCDIVIQRENFARDLRVLMLETTPVERTVVARRLNGLKLAAAGAGIGVANDPAKTADNALCRVRRKLAAAA
jgi:RNA polymerase sigma-H factor